MPCITLRSAKVNFLEQGSGPVLVVLHGCPEDARDYISIIPSLSLRYRVIALDWPGYGLSSFPSRPDCKGPEYFYQVFEEFITALQLTNIAVLGHGMGADIAARFSIEHGNIVRALIMVSPKGFKEKSSWNAFLYTLQGSIFSLPSHLMAKWYLKQTNAYTQAILNRITQSDKDPWIKRLNRALWRNTFNYDYQHHKISKDLSCPTLLLFGRFDPIVPAKIDGFAARECIRHGEFHVLNCGHMVFAERPELFLKLSEPFLKSCNETHQQSA